MRLSALLGVAAGVLAGCTPAGTSASALGGQGGGQVGRQGVTILSLNPCTDALLAQVADRGQIAGLSAYSSIAGQSSMDVALARALPVSGGTLEEVLVVRPGVVVTGRLVPPAMRAAYVRAGLPLVEFGEARSVRESEAQIRRMAALTGHPDRGEALVARIEAALSEAALSAAAPVAGAKPIPALVWQAGGMVPGGNTLITELLARTGFASFSAAMGMRQAEILGLEPLLAAPPRVILVAGGDIHQGPGEDRLLAHPALAHLRGVRRFAFAPRLDWCGGPTIIEAAARLGAVRRAVIAGGGA